MRAGPEEGPSSPPRRQSALASRERSGSFDTRGSARAVDDGMRGGVDVSRGASAGSQCTTARGLYRYISWLLALSLSREVRRDTRGGWRNASEFSVVLSACVFDRTVVRCVATRCVTVILKWQIQPAEPHRCSKRPERERDRGRKREEERGRKWAASHPGEYTNLLSMYDMRIWRKNPPPWSDPSDTRASSSRGFLHAREKSTSVIIDDYIYVVINVHALLLLHFVALIITAL